MSADVCTLSAEHFTTAQFPAAIAAMRGAILK